MIKLTVELKDEKFEWGYEVAKSTHNGTAPLTPVAWMLSLTM